MDFTIVIPTYNGLTRLPHVLKSLQSQTQINSITGEIIVVNNNSTDATAELIQTYQKNWSFSWPLRYYFEPRQGLAFARKKGVKEAKGELIAFIDDDNLPEKTWLYEAYQFSKKYPQAGAFSGKIVGEFNDEPPEHFESIAQFLAIRDHGLKPCLYEPEKLRLPPGAGLVIRQQAWLESVPEKSHLVGRVGQQRIAGEDYEILLYLHKKGWEIWYNPRMILDHVIPINRLSKEYLFPLAIGIGLATCQLRMILAKDWQKPVIWLRTLVGNFKRILFHLLKYKFKVRSDLVAAFELKFYWGSFLSPFFYIRNLLYPSQNN